MLLSVAPSVVRMIFSGNIHIETYMFAHTHTHTLTVIKVCTEINDAYVLLPDTTVWVMSRQ